VDSVIDVTHNVVVPFDSTFGGSWGSLTPASATNDASADANTAVITPADFMCVAPGPAQAAAGNFACGADALGAPYKLVPTATIAPFQLGMGVTTPPAPGQQGFGLYMPGHTFFFQTATLPADGTVWTTWRVKEVGAKVPAPDRLNWPRSPMVNPLGVAVSTVVRGWPVYCNCTVPLPATEAAAPGVQAAPKQPKVWYWTISARAAAWPRAMKAKATSPKKSDLL